MKFTLLPTALFRSGLLNAQHLITQMVIVPKSAWQFI